MARPEGKLLPLITDEEKKPVKRKGRAKIVRHWQSAEAKSLLVKVQQLGFKSQEAEFTEAEKQSDEGQWRLSQCLASLAAQNPEDEDSEEGYFHHKRVLYFRIVEIAPPGRYRNEVLRGLVRFLGHSKWQTASPTA